MNSQNPKRFALILQEGEGQYIEFKEGLSNIDKELVAFANASGGSLFLGINDQNKVVGTTIDNKLMGQIMDIARNCDPSIPIQATKIVESVLEIKVESGADKPYRCKDGFFIRLGAISQKLKRNEIADMIINEGNFRFDEHYNSKINQELNPKRDFSQSKINHYQNICGITAKANSFDLFQSLNIAKNEHGKLLFSNCALLFFSENPQTFFRETGITCVRYRGSDKFSVIDRQELNGDPIALIEDCFKFFKRNCAVELLIQNDLQRVERYDYPLVAIREAIVNAVTHRDYYYDASHIYFHFYEDRLEIENPGGLVKGLSVDDLGTRSARRNRAIADLLLRAKYIEAIGSGFQRIQQSLKENHNPPCEITSSNYFVIRFFPTRKRPLMSNLSIRQNRLYEMIRQKLEVSKSHCALYLGVSEDTALRELNKLVTLKLVHKIGNGKSTYYKL